VISKAKIDIQINSICITFTRINLVISILAGSLVSNLVYNLASNLEIRPWLREVMTVTVSKEKNYITLNFSRQKVFGIKNFPF
jgi:hypothetical protein